MKYRKLGDSDLEVSEISLGSWLTYGVGVEADLPRARHTRGLEAGSCDQSGEDPRVADGTASRVVVEIDEDVVGIRPRVADPLHPALEGSPPVTTDRRRRSCYGACQHRGQSLRQRIYLRDGDTRV